MKYLITLIIFLISFSTYSQSPQGFNYQAIVRDAAGNIRANQGVQFIFEVQDITGNSVYTESHTIVTNKYGLADGIVIGKGSTINNFAAIDWGNGTFYVNVKVDGVDMGTSQLMSVPYALYALKAGSGGGGGGADGIGIQSSVDNGDGTFTLNYTDGTSFTTINLTGPGGKTILSGVFDPIFSDGVDGDFYINTSSNKIFGPKKSGSTPSGWSTGVSLIGDKGDKGDKGDSGTKGDKGDSGDDGEDGSGGFLSGVSDPGLSDGVDGDFYINTFSNKIFGPKKTGATPTGWSLGVSLVGATGDAGEKGDQGDQGEKGEMGITGPKGDKGDKGDDGSGGFLSGFSDPISADGVDGDFFINKVTSTIFGPKSGGNWPSGVSLIGVTGAKGETGATGAKGETGATGAKGDTGDKGDQGDDGSGGFLSGTSTPTSSDGVDGDFYINTSNNTIFGPKKTGATPSGWPSGVSLIGPTGAAGKDAEISGGTGVSVSSNSVSIGQPIGISDNVTFNSITSNLTGNVTGNVTGDVTGDLTGNLTGDVTGNLTGDVTGNLTGDVTGNLTGDVTGNLTGDVTGSVTGSVLFATQNNITTMTGLTSVGKSGTNTTVNGPVIASEGVTGNVTGDLTGDVTGDVSGNAGTVTNGVYTIGDQTIAGTKTFSSTISGSVDGNAATSTKLSTARDIAGNSFDGSADITIAAADLSDITSAGSGAIITSAERTKLSGIETSADVTDATNVAAAGAVMTSGDQTIAGTKTFSSTISGSVDGNAATSTKLSTARDIAGNSFDGSADITIAAADLSDITSAGSGAIITSAERTKLSGIETSADVTDATNVAAAGALMDSEVTDLAGIKAVTISTLQVKPSEGAFADGDKTKLDNIETSADVTDATNVAAAGALMDSEVTDLAGIKAVTISTLQVKPSEGAFADGDKTKLDNIETSADVTDATNVAAAGALMDSEVTDLAGIKAVTISTLQVKPSEGAFADGDKTKLDNIETSADVTDATNVAAAGAVMTSGDQTIAGTKTFSSTISGSVDGTAATVTGAAQTNITSLGTLTALTVDNLGVDGNTITANSGAVNITPAAGSAIVLDGTVNVDAGVITGATSITSTAFVGDITGDVTGNTSGSAATVTGAAQTNITSLGTLTALTVDNVAIDGAVIGHTGDTDLITLADGVFTVAGEIDGTTLDISGNADIDGTTNLDAVDIDGTLTVGVDDTGYDVKLFGSTSGSYILWNESQDELETAGGATINIIKDKLKIGGTAVTTTAAELNIIDGGTSAISTTIVDADRVVLNDDGTMKQVTFSDIKTYVGSNSNAATATALATARTIGGVSFDGSSNINLPGVNTTGNQNTSGSAATVTGAAQTNITSLGTLTALTVDNLGVDGNTITANSGAVNITPAAGSAIVLDGTVNVDAGVITGATSITSTAFVGDITGDVTGNTSGTAATVTGAAQTNITSLGTLTALTVDNLGVDGNTITANSGAVNITPAAGSAIVLDGTVNVDAGVITGATSITSTAFVGDITGDVTGNTSGTAATVTGAAQSNITSLGTLTALTVDNVAIDGAVIGHTGDTDLLTLASDVVTVAGEVDATTLDISGSGDIDGTLTVASGAIISSPNANSVYMGKAVTNTAQYNTGIGKNTFNSLNGGTDNAAIGYDGLAALTSGQKNVGAGSNALKSVTTGQGNIGIGYFAGGDFNTGDGTALSTGSDNIIIGYDADVSASDASNQIVIGKGATGGGDNTVVLGNGSITNWLPTDDDEVDLGSSSKEIKNVYVDGVTYTDAIGFGTVVMELPTADGSANQVLKTDGSGNLDWTTDGGASEINDLSDALVESNSIYMGNDPSSTTDAAEKNIAFGVTALDAITTGDNNVALGHDALTANNSGEKNVSVGNESLSGNTQGDRNTAVGYKAMYLNQTGERNAAFGYASGKMGNYNAAFGAYSLTAVTGNSNTAVGYYAGAGDGSNTAITSGTNNVIVGYQAGVDDAAAANRIVIGSGTDGLEDNTVVLGNGSITNWLPTDDDEVSLGSSSKEMDNIYVDGVTYTDAIGFGTVIMELPTSDGSANQILKTDGSGNLDWVNNTAGGSLSGLGVNSTAAELNIMDGDNSASSTTIVDADRIVLNDNGTMKQVAVTDLKTYTSSGPQSVGWLESYNNQSSTGDSETTVGNLKFRWNTNDYLEVQKVANANSYNATMKYYDNGNGLTTFTGNLTASGNTQYNTSEWKPVYKSWDGSGYNTAPTSLGTYDEMHIEIYEQNSYNVVTGYAIYSIKTFKNGWAEYGYIVTYNVLMQ